MHSKIDDGLAMVRDHAPETFKERADFIRLAIAFTLRALGIHAFTPNGNCKPEQRANEVRESSRTIDTECP